METTGARPEAEPIDDTRVFDGLPARLSHIAARKIRQSPAMTVDRPYISFTFDDFPASAAREGARRLDRFGVRGTYYAATGLIGRRHDLWEMADWADLSNLAADGHEIGLHTHAHRPAWQYGKHDFATDHDASLAALREMLPGYEPQSFAYPYGVGCHWRKRQLRDWVKAARSVHPGINHGRFDPYALRAFELTERTLTPGPLRDLVDETIVKRGWLIFVTHDVSSAPSRYGTSPELLQFALRTACASTALVLPVRDVLARAEAARGRPL